MVDVAVYSTITHQTHEVQGCVMVPGIMKGLQQNRIFEKLTISYCHIYALKFLVHDTSGTYIKVSDLAVAHLPLGQPYRPATGN